MTYLDVMHTPTPPVDPAAMAAALGKAAAKVERLKRTLDAATRERHSLIHQADAMVDAAGVRAFSKYRIAQLAGVKPQAVDQVLAKPAPKESDQ